MELRGRVEEVGGDPEDRPRLVVAAPEAARVRRGPGLGVVRVLRLLSLAPAGIDELPQERYMTRAIFLSPASPVNSPRR